MKIAQIGLGAWGKNHARILSEVGMLSAVCDLNPNVAKEFGQLYSVNHYKSLDDLLNSENFEAAFVVTPTSTHLEIVSKLLKGRKHVFVEKPMTYTSEDGESLLELAKRNKVKLVCGYIERFNPAVNAVKKLISNGGIGNLIMLEFHRENRIPLHIKDVGIIYDTSVHDIDTANWLFNEMPNLVFARAGKIKHEFEDYASIMLGYSNNKIAIISSNWITPKKIRKFNAVCTDAIISSDFISQEVVVAKEESSEIIEPQKQEPLKLEILDFIDAIDNKNDQDARTKDAVNVTKIAEAALLSSEKGVPIYLDLK